MGTRNVTVSLDEDVALWARLEAARRDTWAGTSCMSALVFVDTDVLLYAVDTAEGLQERFRSSFWDALIVAAAQVADCRFLLTEDLAHGQDLDGVRVVNPFRVRPSELEEAAK